MWKSGRIGASRTATLESPARDILMAKGTTQTQEGTRAPVIPEDILRVYRQRTALTEEGMPQFQALLNAGLTGDTEAIKPYLRSYYAPMAAATKSAAGQIRRQVPRGGAQDLAVAQMLQEAALKRGTMSTQLLTRLLDYYAAIAGGFNPERQIGQRQQESSQTKEPFDLKIFGLMDAPIG